jgi:hypothetical protein
MGATNGTGGIAFPIATCSAIGSCTASGCHHGVLISLLHRLRVRWRRWRFLRTYSKSFNLRTGESVRFTPLMTTLSRAETDGRVESDDGEVGLFCPEEAADINLDPTRQIAENPPNAGDRPESRDARLSARPYCGSRRTKEKRVLAAVSRKKRLPARTFCGRFCTAR